MITTTLRKPCGRPLLSLLTKGVPSRTLFSPFLAANEVLLPAQKVAGHSQCQRNRFLEGPHFQRGVRMAERSKALRSGRSLVLQAWVRIPLLTRPFYCWDTSLTLICNLRKVNFIAYFSTFHMVYFNSQIPFRVLLLIFVQYSSGLLK